MSTAKSSHATIDILVASAAWTQRLRGAKAVVRRAAEAALAAAALKSRVEVSVLLTSDADVRKLNATYRGKDKPTNVLSFPALDDHPGLDPQMLGDVAIAFGVTAREAKAEGKSLSAHLSHLVVHGVLHLLGYDHENDKDAKVMESLEKKILSRLAIADPYAEQTVTRGKRRARR